MLFPYDLERRGWHFGRFRSSLLCCRVGAHLSMPGCHTARPQPGVTFQAGHDLTSCFPPSPSRAVTFQRATQRAMATRVRWAGTPLPMIRRPPASVHPRNVRSRHADSAVRGELEYHSRLATCRRLGDTSVRHGAGYHHAVVHILAHSFHAILRLVVTGFHSLFHSFFHSLSRLSSWRRYT